ncbi:hypothetical protein ASG12_10450 [Williamsia sp. Leaf354]|uniref:DUF3046 domain-containing protein n=1 Tax=Williamsia herbipolensis TaxID=1603258 RepID=A0AAU4K3D7_9NOCA|nr:MULTISPECIES: DUF3046 domain-containing protein [Williamsia]KQR98782.1 hypothetical protein ASG12_10450 [Williamsia sp. Leaf354]MCX6470982.1 DUF3046 domain-containing protein [Mycobacteriales bacterium]
MRLTEFTELMETEFGSTAAYSMLRDHVFPEFGGRNGADAVDAGYDPKQVWQAYCRDFDVPRDRW